MFGIIGALVFDHVVLRRPSVSSHRIIQKATDRFFSSLII